MGTSYTYNDDRVFITTDDEDIHQSIVTAGEAKRLWPLNRNGLTRWYHVVNVGAGKSALHFKAELLEDA
jgi:hypothetical protein